MKTKYIIEFISNIKSIDQPHYKMIKEEVSKRESRKLVANTIETKETKINCPHCNSKDLKKWGIRNDLQRYRCKKCSKTFNCITGTPLARLRKKGRWIDFAICLKEGYTVRKSAEFCGVNKATAFLWRHRFLKNTNKIKAEELNGIIETVEIVKKKSYKGSREKPKTSPSEFVHLFFSKNRTSYVFDTIYEKEIDKNFPKTYKKLISEDALFCSAKREKFLNFTKKHDYKHGTLQIEKGEFVKKKIVHLHNVMNYHKNLEGWMNKFHGVATKYLSNYLSWYRGLEEFKFKIKPKTILLRAKEAKFYMGQPLTRTLRE
jgi:transposase-like protein